MKNISFRLAKIADELDNLGLYILADRLTGSLERLAFYPNTGYDEDRWEHSWPLDDQAVDDANDRFDEPWREIRHMKDSVQPNGAIDDEGTNEFNMNSPENGPGFAHIVNDNHSPSMMGGTEGFEMDKINQGPSYMKYMVNK